MWQVVCIVGVCAWWGCAWQGGMHGRGGHAWWGACVVRGGMCGIRDGHCSGQYASYWNAFLFKMNTMGLHGPSGKVKIFCPFNKVTFP